MSNTNQKYTGLNIDIIPNYCSKMSERLYKKLSYPRETKIRNFQIERYLSQDMAFLNDFTEVMAFQQVNYQMMPKYRDNLILLQAHQGTGKTTFLLNQFSQDNKVVLLVEPKKTNIEQITKKYPFAVAFTADSITDAKQNSCQLIDGFTRFVVCVPELALKAYRLLMCAHGRVDYCVLDEAHDIMTSVPSYRETANLFDMIEIALDGNYTKILFVTATPESLSFIHFDDIYKITANNELSADYLQFIQVKTLDPKHIPMTKVYAAKLMEMKKKTANPYVVFLESKNMIDRLKEILTLEGFCCGSITAEDAAQNNPFLNTIVNAQMLPIAVNGRPIDFIFVTSTVVSGISICKNPVLGDRQYQPVILADEPFKVDIAVYQQFLCRFRYHLHHVCIFTKMLDQSKKIISVKELVAAIKIYTKNVKEKISLINEQTSYVQEFLENYQAITNPETHGIDEFAVYCNAFREANCRLYGHKEMFVQAILSHFHALNPVQYFTYTPASYQDLAYSTAEALSVEEQKIIRSNQKMEAAQFIMQHPEEIKTLFAADSQKTIALEVCNMMNQLRTETNTLSLAYKIGKEDMVVKHLETICQSEDSQKQISYSKFDIEKMAAFTELHIGSNITTVLEIALTDIDINQLRLSAKNKNIVAEFKNTELFTLTKKIYAVVLNLDLIKERYQHFENYNDIKNWCRLINSRKMAHAYCNQEITIQDMKQMYLQGEELSLIIESLSQLGKFQIFTTPSTVITMPELQWIALQLNNAMQMCQLTGKRPYTELTILRILSDLIPLQKYQDGYFSTGIYYQTI